MISSSGELVPIGLLTVRSSYSDCVDVGCNLSVFRASRQVSATEEFHH
jgi:hypothetical protein